MLFHDGGDDRPRAGRHRFGGGLGTVRGWPGPGPAVTEHLSAGARTSPRKHLTQRPAGRHCAPRTPTGRPRGPSAMQGPLRAGRGAGRQRGAGRCYRRRGGPAGEAPGPGRGRGRRRGAGPGGSAARRRPRPGDSPDSGGAG